MAIIVAFCLAAPVLFRPVAKGVDTNGYYSWVRAAVIEQSLDVQSSWEHYQDELILQFPGYHMRILYLYKDYFPILGGIENHIKMLAEGLRARGEDVKVLVTNTGRTTVQETINGVPVVKTGRQVNISSVPVSLGFYPALRRLEQGIDIAHAHMPYPPGELGQLLFGRSAG